MCSGRMGDFWFGLEFFFSFQGELLYVQKLGKESAARVVSSVPEECPFF